MGQLMRDQSPPLACFHRELAAAKHNVVSESVGVGVNGAGGVGGRRIGVNAHMAEVVAEAGLEEGASGGVERMAGGTEDIADDARDMGRGGRRRGAALDGGDGLFLLALFAHFCAGRAGTWDTGGFAHDGAGNVVGFALFGVVGIVDGELGLDQTGAKEVLDGLVASVMAKIWRGTGTICGARPDSTDSGRLRLSLGKESPRGASAHNWNSLRFRQYQLPGTWDRAWK